MLIPDIFFVESGDSRHACRALGRTTTKAACADRREATEPCATLRVETDAILRFGIIVEQVDLVNGCRAVVVVRSAGGER